jgi:hypothetical protein
MMADQPLLMKFQKKTPLTERGPAARRGLQFSTAPLPELLEALKKARDTLRIMDSSSSGRDDEYARLRAQDPAEFQRLRRENLALQSDLRAELRRRGLT